MKISSIILQKVLRQPEKNDIDIQNEEFKKEADSLFEKHKIGADPNKHYSDIISEENGKSYQYVNLVQEGGGILGIALLGYTYILEKANIRFLKLAGTSAGAINASMIACMKEDVHTTKSERILKYLNELNMFSFVDGHFIIQKIIKNFITNDDYAEQLAFSIKWFVLLSFGLLFLGNILQWFNISLNFQAICAIFAMSIVFKFIYQNTQRKTNEQMDDRAKELNEQRKAVQKPISWSFMIKLIAILIGVFSVGMLTNYQGKSSILPTDLSVIALLILLVIFLRHKFDKDNLALYTLFFLLLPVFLAGLSFYIPTQYLSDFDKKVIFGVGFVYLAVIIFFYKDLGNRFFFNSFLISTMMIVLGGTGFFDFPEDSRFSYLSLSGIVLTTFLIIIIGGISIYLFSRFRYAEYGINPGDYFLDWLRRRLSENNDNQPFMLSDLKRVWSENVQNIKHRYGAEVDDLKIFNDAGDFDSESVNIENHNPPVAFITSDITTEHKIELPKMWKLYWQNKEDVEVAEFVRASMSIPFFFKPYKKTGIPTERAEYWDKLLNYKFEEGVVPKEIQFVDGGVLSNFPFNIFHRPNVLKTRLPTFGVRLKSSTNDLNIINSIGSYIRILFNAARYNFDKDFLNKNRYYRHCIKEIDVHQYNWLNFFVTPEEKKELFLKGAEAACEFLKSFDWEKYRAERDVAVEKNYKIQK